MSFENDTQEKDDISVLEKSKIKPPRMFKVLMLNDDYTTMDFVVLVLKKFFNKSEDDAISIMMEVHLKGSGLCGVYTYEVAESKAAKVIKYAKENGHPLKCVTEPE